MAKVMSSTSAVFKPGAEKNLRWFSLGGQPACWIQNSTPHFEVSPTGIKFQNWISAEAEEELFKLLRRICFESEHGVKPDYNGLGAWRHDIECLDHKGGIPVESLTRVDEWWRRRKPFKHALQRDHLFSSYVIHPKFQEAVAFYYQSQNWCLLSQLLGKARPRVEAKISSVAHDHPELKWDMAAAMMPLDILGMAFSIAEGRSERECLNNPITLLGLAERPWNFKVANDLIPLLRQPWRWHRDFYHYEIPPDVQEEIEKRWKEKKQQRKQLQRLQPELFHPKDWKPEEPGKKKEQKPEKKGKQPGKTAAAGSNGEKKVEKKPAKTEKQPEKTAAAGEKYLNKGNQQEPEKETLRKS